MDTLESTQMFTPAPTCPIEPGNLTLPDPTKPEGIAVGAVDAGGMGILIVTIVGPSGGSALSVGLDPDALVSFLASLGTAAGLAREIGCAPGCPCGRGGTAH